MKELYDGAIKLLQELAMKHEIAMIICQSFGYNGFKRWHRRRIKKTMKWGICLANDLFDNYRKTATVHAATVNYGAGGLQEHLANWDACLEHALASLIEISKQFFDKTGIINSHIKEALECLAKDREKIRRWYTRFSNSNWSVHDIHTVDDYIHAKEKAKE